VIDDPAAALAFVREHGVVALVSAGELPSFVEAVAGARVRGSWWSHPRGGRMFSLAESLEDSGEVLSMKLVEGKVCFVHRVLHAPLYRVVTDARFVREARARLSAKALALVDAAEKEPLRLPAGGPKAELERSLLVYVGQEHSEKGRHVTVLSSWKKVLDADSRGRAKKLSLQEARAALAKRGVSL
jgi:hypothetical protein